MESTPTRTVADVGCIPVGAIGPWKVERFSVSPDEAQFFNMRSAFNFSGGGRTISPGTYTKLTRNGEVIMSDTPAELRDHIEPIRRATGSCLLNGLGLGVVLMRMLDKWHVSHVDVVEISEDVITLVAPTFRDRYAGRVSIIQADAMTWRPPRGTRYDLVWHDIWDNICGDNLEQMKTLHRAYGRRCDWQGSWCRAECERHA